VSFEIFPKFIERRIQVRSAIKTNRSRWLRMFVIMAALTAKLKLPTVKTPRNKLTIPDPKPCK
jgi:hypothetical protein